MELYPSIQGLPALRERLPGSAPVWLAIGSFDGVHRGHQAVLRSLAENARVDGGAAAVLTFYPHPMVVLRGLDTPYYLTSPDEKKRLLCELGLDEVFTLAFTRELASLTARQFMEQLTDRFDLAQLWVGYDFALGKGREGNAEMLTALGRELGYLVRVLEPVLESGEVISSSRVRNHLREGNVRSAAALLGRRYRIYGTVVRGDGRGHQLGFATANLSTWKEQLLPGNGVYACKVQYHKAWYPAVVNLGVRPTINDALETRLEAHLLDFSADLYGEQLALEFVEWIRPEQRFASLDALVAQVQRDILIARELLTHEA